MNVYTLIRRSLWHYRRTNLGVLLGTAVGTGVLTGALMVGDAVQHSLEQRVHERLGATSIAIATGDAFTSASLAKRLAEHLDTPTAALLSLPGCISVPDGTARANRISILGVDSDFFSLSPGRTPIELGKQSEIALNTRLAEHLRVKTGDTVIIRVDAPGDVSRDLPVGDSNRGTTALRLKVSRVLPPNDFGRFSLRSEQALPMNAFVARDLLASRLDAMGQANLILIAEAINPEAVGRAIQSVWTPEDIGFTMRALQNGGLEMRSRRVFIDAPTLKAARFSAPDATPLLTYFANTIGANSKQTPFSFITGLVHSPLVDGMPNAGITVNRWLADDLALATNDTVDLHYFVVDPRNRLTETNRAFTVHRIVEMRDAATDPELMPDFPGLSDVDNCQDWDPSMPIDLRRVRKKDEAYWDAYRGTPKAFVTLSAAQTMWSNHHGLATAVRFPPQALPPGELLRDIVSTLNPGNVGMRILPVRDTGLRASREGVSFGQLFVGLSFFLIVAALLLTGLLFAFGVEDRAAETGLLLAVGIHRRTIRQFRLLECACLALPGAALGIGVGIACNTAILRLLSGAWQTIVGTVSLQPQIHPSTCMTGFVSGALAAWIAMWLTARKQLVRPPAELQRATACKPARPRLPRLLAWGVGTACWIIVIIIVLAVESHGGSSAAAVFFGAGALALLGCICIAYGVLVSLNQRKFTGPAGIIQTGVRASARRPRQSLAVLGFLATGVFLVIATGANRPGAPQDASDPHSGTGGFHLFAESAIPIFEDIQSESGRIKLGVKPGIDIQVVPLRVFQGDDASCLNLNRVTQPTVLGVAPHELDGRFSFTQTAEGVDTAHPWSALTATTQTNAPPAIADQSVILWGLGKSVGDTLPIQDGRGNIQNVRLIAGTANSILQGSILISEKAFVARYPNTSGHRQFLIEVRSGDPESVRKELSRALMDYGVEITPTPTRLASFASIQDTYLSIFMSLGALALLLGSVGMGIVVARNVMERRGELAMLSALGFKRRHLHRLLLTEHAVLFAAGLISGAASGGIAVLPALRSQGTPVSPLALGVLLAILLINGFLWITTAVALTTRGPLLPSLRQE
jgi:putative ABC transport system permease protein